MNKSNNWKMKKISNKKLQSQVQEITHLIKCIFDIKMFFNI